MKHIICSFLISLSLSVHAADLKISKDCRQSIQMDLAKRHLALVKIYQASYYPAGSDGASSWDSETVVTAQVKDPRNVSTKVLMYLWDANNCRVSWIQKVY